MPLSQHLKMQGRIKKKPKLEQMVKSSCPRKNLTSLLKRIKKPQLRAVSQLKKFKRAKVNHKQLKKKVLKKDQQKLPRIWRDLRKHLKANNL